MSAIPTESSEGAAAILAVDDVPANLLALSAILEPIHDKLVTAATGRQALEVASGETFAAILLDVVLPDMDGFETLRKLRAIPNAEHTPVILITAYELDAMAMDRVQGLGLVDYILKPIAPQLLLSKVTALVSLYRRGEEVRQRDEALAKKDRDIAILAHDLRNPLAAIAMSAAMLLEDDLQPRSRERAARIVRGAARMNNMIRNLTDYARTGRGSLPISTAPMDAGDLCREVVTEFQEVAPSRRIDFGCAGDLAGDWDWTRLYQALSNLLVNSLRYGAGDVVVRAHATDDTVEIAVRNGGPPIAPERLPVIFRPFERGAEDGDGLGLGLYIVREILDAHGGSVSVTSSAEQGTTFALSLPRRR